MLTLEHLKKGDKVLFAGAGHGKDAIHAAQLGMDVTVVELSETMLRKFQEGVDASTPPIEIRKIHDDILKFEEFEQYDMVVANFFLNVFSEEMMAQVLEHLVKMAKPGGKVVIGDFEPPSGSFLKKNFQRVYWYSAVSAFCMITKNAMHKIYDYPAHMKNFGLEVTDTRHYSLLGMNLYWSMMGIKPA
jgi:demethylmenaquinone methyltransferase/2-methoxy-6-polyprenyl-1,4-benzoquinol methylase